MGVTPGRTRPCLGECVYPYTYGPDTPLVGSLILCMPAGAVVHTVHCHVDSLMASVYARWQPMVPPGLCVQ